MFVETDVGNQLLQFGVLFAQLAQLTDLRDSHAGESLPPIVKRRLSDSHLAAKFGDLLSAFCLLQGMTICSLLYLFCFIRDLSLWPP